MKESADPAIPAATLVLYREAGPGPATHLMIKRSAGMAFAAGALVFPGGRVDDTDREIAADATLVSEMPADADDSAARVTAIREAIEETGLAVAVHPQPDTALISAWRAALKAQVSFAKLLRNAQTTLNLAELVPFSRWSPRQQLHRRFDTRFYVAKFAGDAGVEVDEHEASQHLWVTARDAMAGARAGTHLIIFPTMRNLERLAEHASFDAVTRHLENNPVKLISPRVMEFGAHLVF